MKFLKIKRVLGNIFFNRKLHITLTLLVILCISIDIVMGRVQTVDFSPINGDFQNYNVWRRLLDGQIPFKEFRVYLGTGHLVLGSIVTGILGNTFKASLVASHLLTIGLSLLIVFIVAYFILRDIRGSMIIAAIVLICAREKSGWIEYVVFYKYNDGLDAIFTPGVSARMIRSAVVIFVIAGVFLSLYLIEKRIGNRANNKKILAQITCISAISGMGILYSNDVGISSYVVFSFVFFLFLLKLKMPFKNIIGYIIYYCFISFSAFIIAIFIITRGNMGSWFEFTFSAGQYQSWYYGCTEGWKTYYIRQLGFSQLSYMTMYIVIYNLIQFFYKKNVEMKELLYRGGIIYILLTGFFSSNLYAIVSGGSSVELLALTTFSAVLSYTYKCAHILKYKIVLIKKVMFIGKMVAVIFSLCYISVKSYGICSTYIDKEQSGKYVDGLDGYLTYLADDIDAIVDYTKGEELFSTYASAVETIRGDFQPTGTDYIIHVLGDTARTEYMSKFLKEKYKYVLTINRNYTGWELWVESSNWFFYKELYKKYKPTLTTSYSIIWEPAEKENVINTEVDVSLEKISESEYKICCNTDLQTNAIVDLNISYESNFANAFLHNGVYGKYVHITDVTRDEIYGDYHVNYFIPPESNGYSIPVTLKNGVGEIILSTYPTEETSLRIEELKVNAVIKNPF